jgi:hypothetical protein
LTHKARKRFGQNFLLDPLVLQRIVQVINPGLGNGWWKSVQAGEPLHCYYCEWGYEGVTQAQGEADRVRAHENLAFLFTNIYILAAVIIVRFICQYLISI